MNGLMSWGGGGAGAGNPNHPIGGGVIDSALSSSDHHRRQQQQQRVRRGTIETNSKSSAGTGGEAPMTIDETATNKNKNSKNTKPPGDEGREDKESTNRESLSLTKKTSTGSESTAPRNLDELFGLELNFNALYTLTRRLRSGSFATVWVTQHLLTHSEFAVKVIDRTKLKPRDDRAVYREVDVLKSLGSYKGVIALVDFFERPKVFHVVMELARGGDVFDRLAKRTVYTEKDARDLGRNLLNSVGYVHGLGIVHRDLKPENLLLVDEMDDTDLKLADFGFAKRLEDGSSTTATPSTLATNGTTLTGSTSATGSTTVASASPVLNKLTTRCGTPAFVAPEILLGVPYDEKVDMWSVGVILYLLIGGYPPFQHENHQGLFRKIRAADYVFHDKYWENVSIEAKQLISSLLQVNPESRISAAEALRSEWINADDYSLSSRDLSSSLTEIKKFNARRKLKGAMHAVTWAVTATFWNAAATSFSKKSGKSDVYRVWSAHRKATKVAMSKEGRSFRDLYELKKKIRSGSYATVWEGVDFETGRIHAVKVVKRKDLKPKDDAQFLNEVAILQSLKHPHIVQLRDFFEERDYFFMVMELMNGGDVFDRIVERTHYTEKDAMDLAKSLLDAVQFMHANGVAHRDLKPQNLLLSSKDDDADIKVADFGFAKRVHTPQSLLSRCGTPTYVAPEILKNHPHDEAVDMWSVGIIIYVLLVGYPPFMEENQRVLFRKIRMGEYEFFPEDWTEISEEATDLIRNLLVVDPSQRMTAEQALKHPWIAADNDEDLSSRDLSGSLSELRKSLRVTDLDSAKDAAKWATCSCLT